jgi:hypothetical protein
MSDKAVIMLTEKISKEKMASQMNTVQEDKTTIRCFYSQSHVALRDFSCFLAEFAFVPLDMGAGISGGLASMQSSRWAM